MLLTDDVHYTEHIAEHPEERRIPLSTSTVYLTPFTLIRKSIGFPTIADRRRKEGPRRGRVVSRRAPAGRSELTGRDQMGA